jgi:hypothetical protein
MLKSRMLLLFLMLLIFECATPPQVKRLSMMQIEYFDSAIKASTLQSEALILAAEKLVAQAKERINSEESANKIQFEQLMTTKPMDQKTAAQITQSLSNTTSQALDSRKKLDSDLVTIKQKTNEISAFLSKMKEVHLALDAYIQSEKAGEAVLNDILKQPTISSLLNSVNELVPKVQSGMTEINKLLFGI